jgi:hypothetical protein
MISNLTHLCSHWSMPLSAADLEFALADSLQYYLDFSSMYIEASTIKNETQDLSNNIIFMWQDTPFKAPSVYLMADSKLCSAN